MKKFIFDVDGTLTPSRQSIDLEFKKFFNNFCVKYPVYLVTGSDKPKTVEQIGEDTYNLCHTVFNCNGSDVYQSNKNIYYDEWILPESAHRWLSEVLSESRFYRKTGKHFDHRPGMVNFSIVGRNANAEERFMYKEWDEHKDERNIIAKQFNSLFPELEAKVGGETGIDISRVGNNKSQILKYFNNTDKVCFFGDAMHSEGNDYPLAKVINDKQLGMCYHVNDYKQTWEYLRSFK
jgi:phosphomannomutase